MECKCIQIIPVCHANYHISVFTGSFVMRSDITTMLSHLRKCPLQLLDVVEWATREYSTNMLAPAAH